MENSHNEPKYIEVRGTCVHNLKNVNVNVPLHQIVGIAGVSGSGKTTMVLESLIPGLEASLNHTHLLEHVKSVVADGISHVKLIDASPIGINVRSTVATYANVHDELRKVYAKTTEAKNLKHKAGDFSYNTGKLKCPVCDGTGQISLDVQFLPDVDVPCQATDRVRPHAIQAFFHTQEEGALLLFEEQICNCSVVPLSWQIACISANCPKPITELTCKFF